MSNAAQTMGGASPKASVASSVSAADRVAVTKRLQSELMGLMASADPGVSAFPAGDSLFSWVGTIAGSAGTAYEGLTYKLSLNFPAVSTPADILVFAICLHPCGADIVMPPSKCTAWRPG